MVKRINGTLVRITTFNGGAPWRKHGTDRMLFKNSETEILDAIAHRKVAPMGDHGLVIRRAAR